MSESKKRECYRVADENDPLRQECVFEKYKNLQLEYHAMLLIALSDAGIPLEILHKMEPDDIGWEEARSSAASDYAAALREARNHIIGLSDAFNDEVNINVES